LVYAKTSPTADELSTYTHLLSDLLDARISYFDSHVEADPTLEAVIEAVTRVGHDLVICGESCQPLIDRLLFGQADCRVTDQIPTSLLIVRGVRWPLKRILLVVRHECVETNEVALEWVRRLARPSDAVVTVLAIAPPVPAMYSHMGRMQQGLTALLNTDTVLGREMRQIARQLSDWEIDGTLRLRQGATGWQLRLEVAAGDYDLIVMGADRSNRWLRWLTGGQINPLLRWADRPVLIAKPPPAIQERLEQG
jgi:nucleotide-binding universal stress UspA family protein